MKPIVVLYHANCSDGFGAAWAAHKKFGNRADYIGIEPRTLPEKALRNKEIYILDNCYPAKALIALGKRNKSVTVIDHHISNKNDVKHATHHVFDIKHSGAVLAWRYFHPRKTVPLILRYIEDFDLWNFRMPHSREISVVLLMIGFEFGFFDAFSRRLNDPKTKKDIIVQGRIIIDYEKRMIDRIIKNAEVVEFAGYRTLAVNSPVLESEIGNILCHKFPPIAIVWRAKNGKITVSLRSNGKVDVSKIAEKFGGGGHKAASGFALKRDGKLPWKILKPKYEK